MKKKNVVSVVFLVLCVLAIYLTYCLFSICISSDFPQQITMLMQKPLIGFSVSVATSVIASLLFLFLQEKFLHTKQDDAVSRISSAADVLENMETKGILEIKCRNEYKMEYWKNFVKSASGKLVVTGKTLYRWINDEDLKIIFRESLIKKVNAGCEVVFVIYKYEKLSTNDQEEYKQFKSFLYSEVFPEIFRNDNKVKINYKIKEVDSLPYFFLTNGIEVLAMPYFAHVSNNNNLAYRMNYTNSISRVYRDDFDYIIHTSNDNDWIEQYKRLHDIKQNII